MAKELFISKEFTFDSAHKLEWHEGKCKNLHGHTFKLEVVIKGKVDKNGIIIDFKDFKKIVNEKVIELLDHEYLNEVVENPTAENLVVWIWDQLKEFLNLHEIKLWETPTSSAIYRG